MRETYRVDREGRVFVFVPTHVILLTFSVFLAWQLELVLFLIAAFGNQLQKLTRVEYIALTVACVLLSYIAAVRGRRELTRMKGKNLAITWSQAAVITLVMVAWGFSLTMLVFLPGR